MTTAMRDVIAGRVVLKAKNVAALATTLGAEAAELRGLLGELFGEDDEGASAQRVRDARRDVADLEATARLIRRRAERIPSEVL